MKRMLRAGIVPLGAAALLWALFMPAADPWTDRMLLDPGLPAFLLALLGVVAAAALAGFAPGRVARWALAAIVLLAAALQLVAALVLAMLDRPLDLYFDLAQMPSLVGLFVHGAGAWRAAAAFALGALALAALSAASFWALGVFARIFAARSGAAVGLALAVLLLSAGVLLRGAGGGFVSFAATDAIADQGRRLTEAASVMSGFDHRYDAALAAPAPAGDLVALAGRDVILVFVESYGTAIFDKPSFRAALAPDLVAFEQQAKKAGYAMASSRLRSPVFGGGSWLAHGTLDSGLKLDPFLDRLLTESGRSNLGRDLVRTGHRAVAVMPGIKNPWPEASFWGFDATYFARDLDYRGPEFGWFDIPDQYTLAQFSSRELGAGHAPLFAEIVLVSSHTPFAPVPPYVEDWHDAGSFKTVPAALWRHVRDAPDWAHLERPYLASIAYDLQTLAGFLARLDGNGLVIVLGDHQPPGLVSPASAPWTVPIHVLSRDPALVAPFERRGYRAGVMPPRDGVKGMESVLGEFLADFSRSGQS